MDVTCGLVLHPVDRSAVAPFRVELRYGFLDRPSGNFFCPLLFRQLLVSLGSLEGLLSWLRA